MKFIKDVIDFEECALKLSNVFPGVELNVIEKAFTKYFWDDERSDFWEYSTEACNTAIEDILYTFVAEQLNESLFVAKTAVNLKFPLLPNNVTEDYPAGAWL